MTELLPCPFCGSGWLYEVRHRQFEYYNETPAMFCNSCKALVTWEQVEEEGVNDETKTFVREHWNSRAERTCKMEPTFINPQAFENVQEFTCTACGRFAIVEQLGDDDDRPNYCPNCGAKVRNE